MELVQELVFTISFSLIVSLLFAKLFSTSSSFDDGNSMAPFRVNEKTEKEWVVCDDSEKEGKSGYVENPIKGSEEVDFGCVGSELGSGAVFENTETVGACHLFDESPERTEINDFDAGLGGSDEGNVVNLTGLLGQEDEGDDDWQGIEATDLDKSFGAAVAFMDAKINKGVVNSIDNEVKIELYGLHRVAIEGSCFEPQPMALKGSDRANWNSWKRLKNLGREEAMEQYLALLSQHVPGWMGSHTSDKK